MSSIPLLSPYWSMAYATGTFSSRKIERATYDSVVFRFIAANHHPDHDTLAHFRKTFLLELENLFVQVLALAQSMKLVKLGQITLDGTKIKANSSKHKASSHGHIEKLEAQLSEEVQALLKKAAEVDQEELADGIDLPAEIARREDRLKVLVEAKTKIAERDEQAPKDYREKLARREAHSAKKAKSPEAKKLKPPKPAPKPKTRST